MENNIILAANKNIENTSNDNLRLQLRKLLDLDEYERREFAREIEKEFPDLDIDVCFGNGFVVSITFNEFSFDAPKYTLVSTIDGEKGVFRWIEGDRKEVDYRYYNEINENTPKRIYDICNFINQYRDPIEKEYDVDYLEPIRQNFFSFITSYGKESKSIYKFTGVRRFSEHMSLNDYKFISTGYEFIVFAEDGIVEKVICDRETYNGEDLNKFFFKLKNSEMLKQLNPVLEKLNLSSEKNRRKPWH